MRAAFRSLPGSDVRLAEIAAVTINPTRLLGFCNLDVQFRSSAGPERNLCRPEDSKCHEKVYAVSRELQLPRTDVKSEAIYASLHLARGSCLCLDSSWVALFPGRSDVIRFTWRFSR